MKVRDVMTKAVVSCQTGADIGTAARMMLRGGVGTVTVLDKHGRVAGVLTDRDIAIAAGTRQRNASHIGVHEVMSERVRSCSSDDDVAVALTRMEEAHVRRLAVVDDAAHLAGIVSIDDIALRVLDGEGGISAAAFVKAFRCICAPAAAENEVNGSDTFVSG
jgi:CBS domain-containing protein